MIRQGQVLADVGTDHGYISIYLVQEQICKRAIALDIRRGPLERAKEHIRQYGLEEKITTRLSDGVQALEDGEADCMIAAGMGGALTIHIMEDGAKKIAGMKECILQPQSEIARVRDYLWKHNYTIAEEAIVLEDGKFYPMMRIIPGMHQEIEPELYELYAQFGQFLLQNKDPVLRQYAEKELKTRQQLIERLQEQLDKNAERLNELRREEALFQKALSMLDE